MAQQSKRVKKVLLKTPLVEGATFDKTNLVRSNVLADDYHQIRRLTKLIAFRLTNDFVAEHLGHANFADVRELDFPHCSIRTIDLGNGEAFKNLRR